MADHAPNYTPRLKLVYSSKGKTHSMMWRAPRGEDDPSSLVEKMELFLNALTANRFTDFTILSCQWAETDSDVFLPVTPPAPDAGTASLSGITNAVAAASISFVGRSALGKRAVFYLYGTNIVQDAVSANEADFRILASEVATISAAIGVLNETGYPVRGNDGATVSFYPYVNTKYNDHWVGKLRRG